MLRDIAPIVYEGAIAFLKSSYLNDNIRSMTITFANPNALTSILWDSGDWRKQVFGKKSVQRYNVNSFFAQLVAKRIITFQWDQKDNEISPVLGRADNDEFIYNNIASWEGFTFRSSARGGGTIDYFDILHDNN